MYIVIYLDILFFNINCYINNDCNYYNSLLISYSFIVLGVLWEKFFLGVKFINIVVGLI